jgi:hypothetical protein
MSPNACAVAQFLMAKGFDARWRFHRNGSPRFAPRPAPATAQSRFMGPTSAQTGQPTTLAPAAAEQAEALS